MIWTDIAAFARGNFDEIEQGIGFFQSALSLLGFVGALHSLSSRGTRWMKWASDHVWSGAGKAAGIPLTPQQGVNEIIRWDLELGRGVNAALEGDEETANRMLEKLNDLADRVESYP